MTFAVAWCAASARAQPNPDAGVAQPTNDAGEPQADAAAGEDADAGTGSDVRADGTTAPEGGTAPDAVQDAGAADEAVPADEQPAFDPFAQAEQSLGDAPGPDNEAGSEQVAAESEAAGDTEYIEPEDSLFQVEAIDVTAGGLEDIRTVGGGANVVGEEQLEIFNYDDPNQVLVQVPGVYIRSEDGYGLRPNIGLRGVSSDRSKKVTLMEDGVLFAPAPYSASAAYYFPLMSQVASVHVFKGPASLIGGPHTVAGSIDFHTRAIPDAGYVASIEGSGGSYRYGNVHGYVGYGSVHWGLLGEASHIQTAGYKNLDGGGKTGFSKQEGRLKFRLNSSPEAHVYQRLELKLGYAREISYETYLGLADDDFRDTPLRRYAASQLDDMGWWRTQGVARYIVGVGDVDLQVTAYRHDFDRLWERFDGIGTSSDRENVFDILRQPEAGESQTLISVLSGDLDSDSISNGLIYVANNQRRFVSEGIDTRLTSGFETGPLSHEMTAGVRLHYDEIVREHTEDEYLMRSGRLESTDRSRLSTNDSTASTTALALFLVDELEWERWTLSPGVRAELIFNEATNRLEDFSRESQQHAVLGGAGLHYALTDTLGLLAGVHQGFSPAPVAVHAPSAMGAGSEGGGSGQADPERSINYEAGARWIDGSDQLEALAFVNDYDNILTTGSGVDVMSFNGGEALVWGVELTGRYEVELPAQLSLPLLGSYTFHRGDFRSDEPFTSGDPTIGNVQPGDSLTYLPAHQFWAALGLSYGQDRAGFALGVKFIDRMREKPGQGEARDNELTDRYTLLDLSAFYRVIESIKLFAKVDNLTNAHPLAARRPLGGARPVKPLTVQVGAKWEL